MLCAKLRSAAKVWSSNRRSVLCDVLSRADLGCSAPICCAKDVSAENAESSAICPRGWLDSSDLASFDQLGSVELMPAIVKVPSALADWDKPNAAHPNSAAAASNAKLLPDLNLGLSGTPVDKASVSPNSTVLRLLLFTERPPPPLTILCPTST